MKGAGLVHADAVRMPFADGSAHLMITSPPYFALRSYQDDGGHYDGQIGSEPSPVDFLCALWAVMDEAWRVLAPGASAWINLGDKYAGSGGHNNAGISDKSTLRGNGHVGGVGRSGAQKIKATRRSAPDRYNQAADVRAKSLMGLPWRFAMGLIAPGLYRAPFEPAACWHDDGPGPCRSCPPRAFPQWIGRAEVIWSKVNGLPESVDDRVRRSHEQWFHVVKVPRYYAGVDEIREASEQRIGGMSWTERKSRGDAMRQGEQSGTFGGPGLKCNALGKLPGSMWAVADDDPWEVPPEVAPALTHTDDSATVWNVPSAPLQVPAHLGVDHFAAFPQEWPRRLILGWSPSGICTACGEGRRPVVEREYRKRDNGAPRRVATYTDNSFGGSSPLMRDGTGYSEATITGYACSCPDATAPTRPAVVLDPFAGTGTVPMVARALGRYGIGLDLSRDYLRLARWRIWESGHARKTESRTNRERQGALFGGDAA